jgi:hypothetical protein
MLEFAGVMSGVDPTQITTYQVEAQGKIIQGNSVLVPTIEGDNMQAILAIFRGQAILGDAIEQVFETTVPDTEEPALSTPDPDDAPEVVTTLPTVEADENDKGVVPDDTITCT